MTGAALGAGVLLLVGVGAPAAEASVSHRHGAFRAEMQVHYCSDVVEASYRVDRYEPARGTWVVAADVPVTVEARIPGNSWSGGWRAQEPLPHRPWAEVRTGDDGAGSVRVEPQMTTMEYRLRLADGSHTDAVRPLCPATAHR
jgi:hypothetical protein